MLENNSSKDKNSEIDCRHWIVLFFVYLLLTIVVTYPLIFNFSRAVLGPPGLEDSRIFLWEIHQFGDKIFHEFKNPLFAPSAIASDAIAPPIKAISWAADGQLLTL